MIVEHAEFRVLPGAGAEFERAVAGVEGELLSAPGCQSVELLRSVDQPDTYLLRVWWEQLEDHTEVFSSSRKAELFAQAIAPHCAAPPRVIHYEAA